jgi:hypothetical protein
MMLRLYANALRRWSVGKLDAGNPHVRFDEGEGSNRKAGPSLLYRFLAQLCVSAILCPRLHGIGVSKDARIHDRSFEGR